MPAHNGPPPAAAAVGKSNTSPNQTLYLTNLPEKLSKPDLRLLLYTLFSTYGPVLDVNATRAANGRMRGQAHVAFRDVQTATTAMRALQGVEFVGKGMKIQYAKGKSHAIAKLDGTYKMPGMGGSGGGGAGDSGMKGTDLQKEVFGGLPGSAPAPAAAAAQVGGKGDDGGKMDVDGGEERSKGIKRGREDEEEEEEEDDDEGGSDEEGAPMEQDSDDDAPMEEDSDDE